MRAKFTTLTDRQGKKSKRRSGDASDFYSVASESMADLSRGGDEDEGKPRKSKKEKRRSRQSENGDDDFGRAAQEPSSKV